jgi:hypothetical protein
VDTVEKAAVTTPRCTRPYRGVDRAGGDYASRGRERPGVALSRKVRSATCLEGCASGQSRRVPPSSSCLISIFAADSERCRAATALVPSTLSKQIAEELEELGVMQVIQSHAATMSTGAHTRMQQH